MRLVQMLVLAAAALGAEAAAGARPSSADCAVRWHEQPVDQFGADPRRFAQRYLVNDSAFAGGPLVVYAGNEGPVDFFADHIGRAWQLAAALQGVVVFLEHRYFGASIPCPVAGGVAQTEGNRTTFWAAASPRGPTSACPQYLDVTQALADYAAIVAHLRSAVYPSASGAVAIGGSYGGLLAGWLRGRYPLVFDAAVASSAPFEALLPSFAPGSAYWAAVTNDTAFADTPPGGRDAAAPSCAWLVSQAFAAVRAALPDPSRAESLTSELGLCAAPPAGAAAGYFDRVLGPWSQGALNLLAMGDYPFPSSFFGGTPAHPLPPRPLQAACTALGSAVGGAPAASKLLRGLRAALGVFFNTSGTVRCFDPAANPYALSPTWEKLVCRDRLAHAMPFYAAAGWPNDMFWPQPTYNDSMIAAYCETRYNVTPRFGWLNLALPTPSAATGASRILFVSFGLDPFRVGGVLRNDTARALLAFLVPGAAHHEDLFWPTPQDTAAVVAMRAAEDAILAEWVGRRHDSFFTRPVRDE